MMATAAKVTIAEVEQLVEVGELDAELDSYAFGLREADFQGEVYEKENRKSGR